MVRGCRIVGEIREETWGPTLHNRTYPDTIERLGHLWTDRHFSDGNARLFAVSTTHEMDRLFGPCVVAADAGDEFEFRPRGFSVEVLGEEGCCESVELGVEVAVLLA